MKEILLTQGKVALVDDEDFEYFNQWKWSASKQGNTYYALRKVTVSKNKELTTIMHRVITQALHGINIDHINGNGLDNQRKNLRFATKAQNAMNKNKQCNNVSGYKGVSWAKRQKKWRACIMVIGRNVHLGYFTIKETAALAYDKAAEKYYGEFARLNSQKDMKRLGL